MNSQSVLMEEIVDLLLSCSD